MDVGTIMDKMAMWERDRERVARAIDDLLVEYLERMKLLASIRLGREAMRAWRELRALPPYPGMLAMAPDTPMGKVRLDEYVGESLRIFGTELVEDGALHPLAVEPGEVAEGVLET